jgi:hypothetical protein
MAARKRPPKARQPRNTPDKKLGGPGNGWAPDEQDHRRVRAWLIAGFTQKEVAARMGVTDKTLRQHCAADIDYALMDAVTQTGATVLQMANGRPAEWNERNQMIRDELAPDIAAARFFLRTRGRDRGWGEHVEFDSGGAAALFRDVNFAVLSDVEIATFAGLCSKIGLRLPVLTGLGAPEG